MLSLPSQQPSPAPIILDIALDNWSIFHQSFKVLCFTKFGVAGQQILSNCALPLTPFANGSRRDRITRFQAGLDIFYRMQQQGTPRRPENIQRYTAYFQWRRHPLLGPSLQTHLAQVTHVNQNTSTLLTLRSTPYRQKKLCLLRYGQRHPLDR